MKHRSASSGMRIGLGLISNAGKLAARRYRVLSPTRFGNGRARTAWLATQVLVVAVLAGAASAVAAPATIYSGTNVDVLLSDPVAVGSGSQQLWQVTLLAVTRDGAMVGGFDGRISGQLHQQIAAGLRTPTLDEPLPDTTLATAIDSHFLVHGSQVLSVFAPSENWSTPTPSSEPPDATGTQAAEAETLFGNSLDGTFALLDGPRINWPIAQLVAPQDSSIELDFFLGFGGESPPAKEHVLADFVLSPSLYRTCGDLDSDGDVDSADLLSLLGYWTGSEPLDGLPRTFDQGDCDGDGDVDTADLLGLLGNWTLRPAAGSMAPLAAAGGAGLARESALATVPEPAGLGFLGLLLLAALPRQARRSVGGR